MQRNWKKQTLWGIEIEIGEYETIAREGDHRERAIDRSIDRSFVRSLVRSDRSFRSVGEGGKHLGWPMEQLNFNR